jgi:NAD(P)-dependent dehydrogenase (short-subunit alcohol dehydrogenase family)
MAEDLVAGIPMGRVAEPEEVSETIIYLLSDESSYISGQILPVNGGSV